MPFIQKTAAKPDRSVSMILTAVNVLLVLTIIVITAIIMNRPATDNSQPLPAMDPETCVECAHLTRNLHTLPGVDGWSKRHEDGTDMCCVTSQEQMSAMLQVIMENTAANSDPEPEVNAINLVPVSAHKRILSGDPRESSLEAPYFNGGTRHFTANFSKEHDSLTEHAHGVDVLDSALRIQTTGLYYVYISVHIGPQFNIPARNFKEHTWFQYVYRQSPDNPANSGPLLEMAYPSHGDSVDYEETDYRGGVFQLKEGDRLLACFTGLGLIRYQKESSFLGVVMLSNGIV